MNRVAIVAAACAVACSAAPAQAATIFVAFDVTATGTHQSFFRAPAGEGPVGGCSPSNGGPFVDCHTTSPLTLNFHFAQDFNFTNGVATYFSGTPFIGQTSFTLTQAADGFLLGGFNYLYSTIGPAQPYGSYDVATAPGQVIAAPEPASWAMLLLGFGGLAYGLRRVGPSLREAGRSRR